LAQHDNCAPRSWTSVQLKGSGARAPDEPTAVQDDVTHIGTVGKPLPGVELKLADDGGLLVRGPNVIRGSRNDPDKTAEAIDADGCRTPATSARSTPTTTCGSDVR